MTTPCPSPRLKFDPQFQPQPSLLQADLEDEALEDGEGGGPQTVQGKDDIIELDWVHTPRMTPEIHSLWEDGEREEKEKEG